MTRFNALVLAKVIGAVLETVFRTGLPEIAPVAVVLVARMAVYRHGTAQRRVTTPE